MEFVKIMARKVICGFKLQVSGGKPEVNGFNKVKWVFKI